MHLLVFTEITLSVIETATCLRRILSILSPLSKLSLGSENLGCYL